MRTRISTKKILLITGCTVLLAGIIYSGYLAYIKIEDLKKELQITTQTSTEAIALKEQEISKLSQEISGLNNILTEEQKKNLDLEKLKKKNAKKIDTLEKLTTIDPELLKKYSKVFFLSENYNPPKLEDIAVEFRVKPEKDLKILKEVEPFLHELLTDANEAGVNLRVISSYRSFDEQKQLKSNYSITYGSGANQFSADQGYSEHQLGTTVDFGTTEVTGAYMSFENTTAFTWLTENAHKYGFILSYPKGNSYYQYEPWHWRFVGEDLADDLHDDGTKFYELDQREIDEYLIKIFD